MHSKSSLMKLKPIPSVEVIVVQKSIFYFSPIIGGCFFELSNSILQILVVPRIEIKLFGGIFNICTTLFLVIK